MHSDLDFMGSDEIRRLIDSVPQDKNYTVVAGVQYGKAELERALLRRIFIEKEAESEE